SPRSALTTSARMIQPQPTPYTARKLSQMSAWATGNNTCRTNCHCVAPFVTATSRYAAGTFEIDLMTIGSSATKQPMNRNPTFCNSLSPNQASVNGTNTTIGT